MKNRDGTMSAPVIAQTLVNEPKSEGVQGFVVAARELREHGKYREAIKGLEVALEYEGDSDLLWGELALTQYDAWHHYATQLHKPGVVTLVHWKSALAMTSPPEPQLLQARTLSKAYNSFIVAMEYPSNKKQPMLLTKMVMLYLEFQAYRGALSLCTLLVEGYATHSSIQESIFLCAVSARALEKRRECAQYFQHIVDKPPYRLAGYHLLLLAGLQLEKVSGMRDHMRELYSQAYKQMIGLSPVTLSEKEAHHIYRTSHKNESQRLQMWFSDNRTWFDLANKLMNINFPLLVCDVIELVQRRAGSIPSEMLITEGVARFRVGETQRAVDTLASALTMDYWSTHCRFLLTIISEQWRQQFIAEEVGSTQIQRTVRRHWMRKAWRTVTLGLIEAKRRRAAVSIQCAWRQHAARGELAKLLAARREREQSENRQLADEDWFVILRRMNCAAANIQSLHKIVLAKREAGLRRAFRRNQNRLLETFAEHRSGASLKRTFVFWLRFIELRKQKRWSSASVIQRQVRCFFSRKLFRRLLQARCRQDQIIALCLGKRAYTIRRIAMQRWCEFIAFRRDERNKASCRIQQVWRRHLARKRYHLELRRHMLATELMHRMLADKQTQILRSIWSALSANALYRRMQKHRSAVTLQRHARGMIARRLARRLRSRRRRVAVVVNAMRARSAKQLVQRVFDGLLLFLAMQRELRDASVVAVQRIFRGFAARKRLRFLAECNRILKEPGMTLRGKPEIYVKRVCFLLFAQLPEQNRIDRRHAGIKIQRWYLQAQRRRRIVVALSKLRRQRAILNTLQATFRTVAFLFFSELKRRIQARQWRRDRMVRRIQRTVKRWLTYRRYCRVLSRRESRKARAAAQAWQRQLQLLGRCVREWHSVIHTDRKSQCTAAVRIQRMYRARIAKRQAQRVLHKRAARARLLESLHLKPLERWFRRWEECVIEKSVLRVRFAAKTNGGSVSPDKWRMAIKWDPATPLRNCPPVLTLEQRAELPSLLFYTLLNRVRQSGILQLSFAGGLSSVSTFQLQQLLGFASSVIVDGGGAQLVELVVTAMATLDRPSPAQKLIFYNARLSAAHAATLYSVLKHPGCAVTSLVLSNVPLTPSAVTALATALCHGHSKLEQLVLEACAVGNVGAAALAEAAVHSRRLWKLDLSQNHVGDGAAAALAQALVASASLRVLSLSGTALSDRGVLAHLAPALARAPPSLQSVVLRGTARISPLGHEALQQAATNRSCVVLLR